jgi:hypothetical protein
MATEIQVTRKRHFNFSAHIAAEFLVGVAVAVAPLVFDFDEGATVASVAFGVAIATGALSTSISGYTISLHRAWDRALVVLLVVAVVVSAIVDVGVETAVFATAALIEGVMLAITRYVPDR